MTNYMRDAVNNNSYDYTSLEKKFTELISVLKPLGKDIFRHSNAEFATALYDTIMIGVAENILSYKTPDDLEKLSNKIKMVKTDEVLVKFTRKGGNNQRGRIKNRLREANRIFGQQ